MQINIYVRGGRDAWKAWLKQALERPVDGVKQLAAVLGGAALADALDALRVGVEQLVVHRQRGLRQRVDEVGQIHVVVVGVERGVLLEHGERRHLGFRCVVDGLLVRRRVKVAGLRRVCVHVAVQVLVECGEGVVREVRVEAEVLCLMLMLSLNLGLGLGLGLGLVLCLCLIVVEQIGGLKEVGEVGLDLLDLRNGHRNHGRRVATVLLQRTLDHVPLSNVCAGRAVRAVVGSLTGVEQHVATGVLGLAVSLGAPDAAELAVRGGDSHELGLGFGRHVE